MTPEGICKEREGATEVKLLVHFELLIVSLDIVHELRICPSIRTHSLLVEVEVDVRNE